MGRGHSKKKKRNGQRGPCVEGRERTDSGVFGHVLRGGPECLQARPSAAVREFCAGGETPWRLSQKQDGETIPA